MLKIAESIRLYVLFCDKQIFLDTGLLQREKKIFYIAQYKKLLLTSLIYAKYAKSNFYLSKNL